MGEEFDKSVFSFYFNALLYLGVWAVHTKDPQKKFLYSIYFHAITIWNAFMFYMGVLDFFDSIPKINKMVYNVCFNIFLIGTMIKVRLTVNNYRRIDGLRRKMHRSVTTCKDAQELLICNAAVEDLNFIVKIFFWCMVVLYPLWFILHLLSDSWGERKYPLPSRWITDVDIKDPKVFFSISALHGVFAGWFVLQAASFDAAIFGLLAQLCREYRFLIKKINEFGDFCEDMYRQEESSARVGNTTEERKAEVKDMLGKIIARQKDLFEFSEDFEYSYNKTMFVHIFAGGTLLCVNGFEAMIVSFQFSVKMVYQFGYAMVILTDILYLCWMTNRISEKCREVGSAFYGIPWYKLEVDIQRNILLVILRSQKPPRITSGNFVELNLSTSMALLKNIYGWLAMFRQVALK